MHQTIEPAIPYCGMPVALTSSLIDDGGTQRVAHVLCLVTGLELFARPRRQLEDHREPEAAEGLCSEVAVRSHV